MFCDPDFGSNAVIRKFEFHFKKISRLENHGNLQME
jgi:hypothetical protein